MAWSPRREFLGVKMEGGKERKMNWLEIDILCLEEEWQCFFKIVKERGGISLDLYGYGASRLELVCGIKAIGDGSQNS